MLSATDQNKPFHFIRRFTEGWFSVYLSIFLVTLTVRLLFFPTVPLQQSVARHANSGFTSSQLIRHGFSHIIFSLKSAGPGNTVRFGHINELTAN